MPILNKPIIRYMLGKIKNAPLMFYFYKMKKGLLGIFILMLSSANAQSINPDDEQKLIKLEEGLLSLSLKFTEDSSQNIRQKTMYRFIVTLKEALKLNNSFYYPFEKITQMNTIYSQDKKFRIFTMQLTLDNQTCRHFGAIQMNSQQLKLIPLIDMSDTFPMVPTNVITNKNWWGQTYYNIVDKKVGKVMYYFLFGYDQNDLWSKKKLIEPMSFVNDSLVNFGAPLFEVIENEKKKIINRFCLEYKRDAVVSLNYKEEYKAVVFDHTHPQDEKLEGLYFGYIPDGTYEGFVWKKNKWIWVEKFKINNNPSMETAPIPLPQEKSGRMK